MHSINKSKLILLATTAFLVTAAPVVASAQTVDDGKIETVIVTARKQSEDLLKVPVAITAFTGNDLAVRGIDSLDDLTDFTPGLTDDHNSSGGARSDRSFQQLIIRGMNPSAVSNPTTSIFLNGVPVASPDFIQNLDDVDHVDVLKGPQSAFFGRETFAGAVNVTTKAASNTFSGNVSAEIGNRRTEVLSGDINVPIISDKLSVRAGYTYDHHDGSYTNPTNPGQTLGDQTTKTVHFSITARPIENLTIKGFGMILQDDDGPAATGILIAQSGPFNQGNCTVAGAPYFCGTLPGLISSVSPAQNTTISPTVNFANLSKAFIASPGGILHGDDLVNHFGLKRNAYHGDLNVEYDIPSLGLSLTYLGGFNHDNYSEISDLSNESGAPGGQYPGYTGFPFEIQNEGHDFSHEFRIATNPNKPYRALLGVSYVDAYADQAGGAGAFGPNTTNSFGPTKSETTGVFFSLAYDILPQLTINFDGRYQQDKEIAYNSVTSLVTAQGTSNDFLPRVSLQYKITPDIMTYFTYSQGVNPGQFNSFFASLPAASKQELTSVGISSNPVVKPEDLTNYEIGVKGRFFGGRATLSADVYYDKWTNQLVLKQYTFPQNDPANPYNQVGTTFYVPPGNVSIDSFTYYDNSASSTAKGIEAEAVFIPIDHLTVSLAGAINDTQYDQFLCTSCTPYDAINGGYPGVSAKGKYLPNSPKDSFTGGIEYANRVNFWSATDWFARADYIYKDGVYIQSDNTVKTPDITHLVNVRAGINWSHFSVEAFVDNLFNDKAYTSGFSNVNFAGGFGYNVVEVGLPTLITGGVKFKYKF